MKTKIIFEFNRNGDVYDQLTYIESNHNSSQEISKVLENFLHYQNDLLNEVRIKYDENNHDFQVKFNRKLS